MKSPAYEIILCPVMKDFILNKVSSSKILSIHMP